MWTSPTVLATLAVALALAGPPGKAWAQQADRIYRIGVLANVPKSNAGIRPRYRAFYERLRDLGYVEGQNIVFDYRYPETMSGREARLAQLAAGLVADKPDVIFTWSSPASDMAQQATRTIPIVVAVGVDRHVKSFSRPGGNVTGLSSIAHDLIAKQLQIFREALPGLRRVAVIWNPEHAAHPGNIKQARKAAAVLGLDVVAVDVRGLGALPAAFDRMKEAKVDGALVFRGGMLVNLRPHVSDLANARRIPTMFGHPVEAQAGGLISYGTSVSKMFGRAADYVDKILKGAKPADLPVEQPSKFDLVVNLKTARMLGIAIPRSILLRADQVIE